MGTMPDGGYYSQSGSNESIDRATTGVFSTGWESFKQDWKSLKLDWESVEGKLGTLDGPSRDKFLARAKEATLRLKAIMAQGE
jgi:hypothetical protein